MAFGNGIPKGNGKKYIGSGFNLSKRLRSNFQPSYLTLFNYPICNAILKYACCHNHFSLVILEICENSITKEQYLAREQFYINLYDPEYNILKFTHSSLGFKHSPATKQFLSESRKGENNPMFGKDKSSEFIAQMYKDKSGSNNPKAKSTIIIDTLTDSTYTFGTVKEAALFLQSSKSSIVKYRDKDILFKNRWLVKNKI
jgi:group I intron endonuclease